MMVDRARVATVNIQRNVYIFEMKIDLYLEEVSRLTDTVCGNESDSRRNKIRGESRVGSGQDTCETSKWIYGCEAQMSNLDWRYKGK